MDLNTQEQMKTSIYLGPLDIDYIGKLNNTLDDTINFGFTIVRPIGKFVLWFLKIIHNTLNLNYGICLIIFAVIIQLLLIVHQTPFYISNIIFIL